MRPASRGWIAGNRLHDIGPDRGGQPIAGVRVTPPFGRVAVDDNTILRLSDQNAEAQVVAWSAIDVTQEPIVFGRHFAAASFVMLDNHEAFVLTANRLTPVRAREDGVLSVRGNHLGGWSSRTPLTQTAALEHCLFQGNVCEATGQVPSEPTLGRIAARTITVSDNRLRSPGDLQTVHLQPQVERAIVIGNTSTGPIVVQGGAPVPADISLTNVFPV